MRMPSEKAGNRFPNRQTLTVTCNLSNKKEPPRAFSRSGGSKRALRFGALSIQRRLRANRESNQQEISREKESPQFQHQKCPHTLSQKFPDVCIRLAHICQQKKSVRKWTGWLQIQSADFPPAGLEAATLHIPTIIRIPHRLVLVNQFGATLPGSAGHDSRLTQSEPFAASRTTLCIERVELLKVNHNFLF